MALEATLMPMLFGKSIIHVTVPPKRQVRNRKAFRSTKMTRGNQRDVDRARAAARHAGKGESREGDHLQRKVYLLFVYQHNKLGLNYVILLFTYL